jgi:Na+-driven multidrug efflux pump
VGRLGANAVATVGLTESMLSLVFAVGMGLSLSTTAMVARRIGEKDPEGAAVAGVQAIVLGLMISVAIGIPCFIYAPHLLRLMGASGEIVSTGSGYARIALGGSGAVLLLFLNNAIFRGAGDAAIAMRLLWVSNIINLILDPCLIFGLGPFPRLGVTGAALATFTGRSIGVLYQFYRLLRGTERIRILRRQIRLNLERAAAAGARVADRHSAVRHRPHQLDRPGAHRQHLRRGRARGIHHRHSHRHFRDPAVVGMSNAAATLVGQNLGAKKPERAETAVWRTGLYNMLFLGSSGVVFIVFAEPIVRLFTHDPAVVPLAAACLRIVSYGNIGYAYGMVMLQAFNGAGDTVTPTIVNFFGFWLLEIPLAYWLAIPMHLHSNGVFFSIAIAESSMAAASAILFKRGKWKKQKIYTRRDFREWVPRMPISSSFRDSIFRVTWRRVEINPCEGP